MLPKTRLMRIILFFIIYLCINLLVAKLRNYDSVCDSLLSAFRNSKIDLRKNEYDINIVKKVSVTKKKAPTEDRLFSARAEKERNEKIMKQIMETCKENNLTTSMLKQNFAYNPKFQGIYCWIKKAGSTRFMKLFSNAYNNNDAYFDLTAFKQLAPKNEALLKKLIKDPSVFKLLIIRHPFERLVSAYRDRIEDNSKYTQESYIYVPKIFKLTRPELFKSQPADFVIKIFNEEKRLKLVPSFSEFVQWILQQESDKDDPHWNQYYNHCALCSVHYDYILKLDNYTNNEITHILTRMNVIETNDSLLKLEQERKVQTDYEITCNYFKNLTHEAVVNLYEKYKIDFDMFNYEFDKYFECTDGD